MSSNTAVPVLTGAQAELISNFAKRPSKYANDQNKAGGDISDAFSSLSGGAPEQLPPRYSALKYSLGKDRDTIIQAWNEVLDAAKSLASLIRQKGAAIIPQVEYRDIVNGTVPIGKHDEIRSVGSVIVKGAITKEEALAWKAQIQEYSKLNKDRAVGFPAHDPQVWEFYNTRAQTQARTHPAVLATQKYLLSQWHASPDAEISLADPITYFDRLRIRHPGDMHFALGPHIDGGSVERWEDPTYRKCFSALLTSSWHDHDPFDATNRLSAIMDMYKGQGACNVFRPWQGWVSMSTTKANEGTLQVFPNIGVSTAYLILRPFFKARKTQEALGDDNEAYLASDNWVFDLDATDFPGSVPGRGQELSDKSHPHLDLSHTMTSMPLVEPGDQVYWHCDVIHAVETRHSGKGDSSVMYIPAVPLTVNNAEYLASQRAAFLGGYPPYDFSGGEGEKQFKDRATLDDVYGNTVSRRAMGLAKFAAGETATPGQKSLVAKANEWLFVV